MEFEEAVQRITEIKETQKRLAEEYDRLSEFCLLQLGPGGFYENDEIHLSTRIDHSMASSDPQKLKEELNKYLSDQIIDQIFEQSTIQSPRSGGLIARLKGDACPLCQYV